MRPDRRTLLSGLLIVLAFPPWNGSFLIWFALVPFFLALRRCQTTRQGIIQGLWISILMTLGGYYWVAYASHNFGQIPWVVAVLVLLGFSLGNQLVYPLFGALFVRCRPQLDRLPSAIALLLMALLFSTLDAYLPKLFLDTLGHALFNAEWMRQAADLGGAYFLTFTIVGVNLGMASLVEALLERREPSIWPAIKKTLPASGTGLVIFLAILVYGILRSDQVQRHIDSAPVTVRAGGIQANIGDFEKVAAETGFYYAGEKILKTHFLLSDQAIREKVDFLVWPETAYPSKFRTPMNTLELSRDQKVERFVRSRQVPLLFGGYDQDKRGEYNSVFMLSPQTRAGLVGEGELQVYHKSILLPFGEYIPGFGEDSVFKDWFPAMGFFGRGPGAQVYEIPLRAASDSDSSPKGPPTRIKISPVICYEALLEHYLIKPARDQNHLILNVTNDSWFGPYGEPELHLALTVFRSIETRMPQLRVTNTGISAMIQATGEITQESQKGVAEVFLASIPIIDPIPTLFVRWGADWFKYISLGILLAWAVSLVTYPRRRPSV